MEDTRKCHEKMTDWMNAAHCSIPHSAPSLAGHSQGTMWVPNTSEFWLTVSTSHSPLTTFLVHFSHTAESLLHHNSTRLPHFMGWSSWSGEKIFCWLDKEIGTTLTSLGQQPHLVITRPRASKVCISYKMIILCGKATWTFHVNIVSRDSGCASL